MVKRILHHHRLRDVIKKHGDRMLQDQRMCEAILNDYFPEDRRLKNLLILANKENIFSELNDQKTDIPPAALFKQMVDRLVENCGIENNQAHFCVALWAYALDSSVKDVGRFRSNCPQCKKVLLAKWYHLNQESECPNASCKAAFKLVVQSEASSNEIETTALSNDVTTSLQQAANAPMDFQRVIVIGQCESPSNVSLEISPEPAHPITKIVPTSSRPQPPPLVSGQSSLPPPQGKQPYLPPDVKVKLMYAGNAMKVVAGIGVLSSAITFFVILFSGNFYLIIRSLGYFGCITAYLHIPMFEVGEEIAQGKNFKRAIKFSILSTLPVSFSCIPGFFVGIFTLIQVLRHKKAFEVVSGYGPSPAIVSYQSAEVGNPPRKAALIDQYLTKPTPMFSMNARCLFVHIKQSVAIDTQFEIFIDNSLVATGSWRDGFTFAFEVNPGARILVLKFKAFGKQWTQSYGLTVEPRGQYCIMLRHSRIWGLADRCSFEKLI